MKTIKQYLCLVCLLLIVAPAYSASEASFRKLYKTYTLNQDGSMEERVYKELKIFTHAAMNSKYGETFIVYNPEFQELKINESYTIQKDGSKVVTPANAFVEVLPSFAADAPAYNHLKEMVVVHTGLELGATIVLDYSIKTKAAMCGELDVFTMIKELSPIEDFRLTVNVPESKMLNYELLNSSAKPEIKVNNGLRTISYKMKNIAPRPYSYPVYSASVGIVQQVASGMMPAFTASTYKSNAVALEVLRKQLAVGDSKIIENKILEIKKETGDDKNKLRMTINKFMTYLYSVKGQCGVSLSQAGYRVRPASEVLLSMYGTRAELANLDNVLHKAAGFEAEIKIASIKASDINSVGLSGVVAVLSDSEMSIYANGWYADVQDYMSVVNLNGVKSLLISDKPENPTKNIKTIELNETNSKTLPGGYVAVTIPDTHIAATLYPYSANTSISESMLLPHKLNRIMQYNVKLPKGKTWIEKRNVKVSNEVGEVAVEYEPAGDELKVTCTYKIDEQLITKENYRLFYSLMSECKDMNNYILLFK